MPLFGEGARYDIRWPELIPKGPIYLTQKGLKKGPKKGPTLPSPFGPFWAPKGLIRGIRPIWGAPLGTPGGCPRWASHLGTRYGPKGDHLLGHLGIKSPILVHQSVPKAGGFQVPS